MARDPLEGPRPELHDADRHAWALEQAERLRDLAQSGRCDPPPEWRHIAEALEAMARAERVLVREACVAALRALLKLDHSADAQGRPLWEMSLRDARATLRERMTASIQADILDHLAALYAEARRLAMRDLEGHGEFDAAADAPRACCYSIERLLLG